MKKEDLNIYNKMGEAVIHTLPLIVDDPIDPKQDRFVGKHVDVPDFSSAPVYQPTAIIKIKGFREVSIPETERTAKIMLIPNLIQLWQCVNTGNEELREIPFEF